MKTLITQPLPILLVRNNEFKNMTQYCAISSPTNSPTIFQQQQYCCQDNSSEVLSNETFKFSTTELVEMCLSRYGEQCLTKRHKKSVSLALTNEH